MQVIQVQHLSKKYQIYERPWDKLREMFRPSEKLHREFWALQDVSFTIEPGQTLGIIGQNGSGKSTLLQILAGIMRQTRGDCIVKGKVSALLELGSGFNPEFTGRENVYFQGALMGLPKEEMDRRFGDIATFADIGKFMDQPVRTYSSGMFVRLAFASAINVDPDILVVDEALAVGDTAFQRKCFAHVDCLRDRGSTVVFVSHDMSGITSHCNNVLLLDQGELAVSGSPNHVVNRYLAGDGIQSRSAGRLAAATSSYDPTLVPQSTVHYPKYGAEILMPRILNADGEPINLLNRGMEYRYVYDVHFDVAGDNIRCGMLVKTVDGRELGGLVSSPQGKGMTIVAGMTHRQCFRFRCNLLPGTYFVNAGVTGPDGNYLHRIVDAAMFTVWPEPHSCRTGIVDISSAG